MKRFLKRNKNWLIPVAVILAVGLCLGIGMGAFDGFGDSVKQQTVNEANILKYDDYKDIAGEHSGVNVKVLKDGSIKLDGTATADVKIVLTENVNENCLMTFAALDMGDEAENSYIGVCETEADSGEFEFSGKTSASSYVTFMTSEYNAAAVLVIESGDSFDEVTLRPVLTYGAVPQTFYTIV